MLFSLRTLFCLISFSLSSIPFSTAAAVPDAAIVKAGDDPSYADKATFQRVMISTHNKWRREHGVKDVSWDTNLADFAEKHVKKCLWGHSGGPYGENLSAGYKTAQLALDAWGDERNLYKSSGDYDKTSPPTGTGHFTQMVWAGTDKIGCARMKCVNVIKDGFESWVIVCEYTAPGNVQGAYTKNVFKPVRRL